MPCASDVLPFPFMPSTPIDPHAFAAAGGTLRHLLRLTPRVAPERAAVLVAGIARAAATWHARGGGHGALTPERVLVGPDDEVTLAPPPRQEGAPAPWPTYLAPEQIDGRPGDVRSDVYALGLLAWEMLAGQQPWEGESLYGVVVKQREQDLPRLSTLRPGLPRALVVAVEGCLHKAPGDRWQNMAEFLAALGPAFPPAAAPEPPIGRPREVAERRSPPPATPPAGVVARAAAAGVVPGAGAEPPRGSVPADRPRVRPVSPPPRAPDDDDDTDDVRTARRPVGAAPARGRWLAGAVLGIALLGAAGAAVFAVRSRDTGRATQTWLDSVTTPPGAAGTVGAAAAATTRENTTAVPVQRSRSSAPSRPEVSEAPAAETEDLDTDTDAPPPEAPVLQPTPPLVPPGPPRPIRPTVPRPDTTAPPEPATRR
jgi:serine/threonine-protein kinase